MVRLPEGYCIDSTEVTRGQYQAWLDASPSTEDQSPVCTGNRTFEPDTACMVDDCAVYGRPCVFQGADSENHPVVCVDWCDAYAYCHAVGKRLCGKIGGGPNGYDDDTDARLSQWYNACVSGAAHNSYPYGDSYEERFCNGGDYYAAGTTTPVGSLLECQSSVEGYEGVFDLSGNVLEWEDSCDETEQPAVCLHRGGVFHNSDFNHGSSGELSCRSWSYTNGLRDSANPYTGFRCCSR